MVYCLVRVLKDAFLIICCLMRVLNNTMSFMTCKNKKSNYTEFSLQQDKIITG